jgi:hypothetical protein
MEERRFAVFDVGEYQMQDLSHFAVFEKRLNAAGGKHCSTTCSALICRPSTCGRSRRPPPCDPVAATEGDDRPEAGADVGRPASHRTPVAVSPKISGSRSITCGSMLKRIGNTEDEPS